MNADLNEKLKQYQRNYYASKKNKKMKYQFLLQYKDKLTDTKIWQCCSQ